ncbi:MAG: 50S ribosomal protein L32 [Sphingobacteriales bacterium]|jgi:large subunit ribosomal protein L32|nr:50S ribosomal protein L32 [Sphingobacteriales bacterium]MBP9140836.1 50S ribosomal protein L32 [Chitinophagales bacterium]MDA0198376.1 50S ribosomal protein L32 [Bacteroidota bacterium]MBK6891182.1 50S ribosomal protein L32 [Sphingobacteriales bacterium]MBK7526993.1 50S ribosomal protein L32 [Sphingobacteriales bacterium]
MAHPKRKISKTRRDKRRTHYKAVAPTLSVCGHCGAAVLAHRVCGECGFYRGQQIFAVKQNSGENSGE